jgi:hypothetical protein
LGRRRRSRAEKATQPGGELERAEEGVQGRSDDVRHHGRRDGVDARVGGQQLRAAGGLDQPE